MFTKRHYELLANTISAADGSLEVFVALLVTQLQIDNPRFDPQKFRDACAIARWIGMRGPPELEG